MHEQTEVTETRGFCEDLRDLQPPHIQELLKELTRENDDFAGLSYKSKVWFAEFVAKREEDGYAKGEEDGYEHAQETVGEWNRPQGY